MGGAAPADAAVTQAGGRPGLACATKQVTLSRDGLPGNRTELTKHNFPADKPAQPEPLTSHFRLFPLKGGRTAATPVHQRRGGGCTESIQVMRRGGQSATAAVTYEQDAPQSVPP